MDAFSAELRLALTLLLNAGVFGCAYRLARRRGGGGPLQAACDAFLAYFVVQYVAVALPGALGGLNLWTMSLVAFAALAGMWFAAGKAPEVPTAPQTHAPWAADHFALLACFTFFAAYLAAHVYQQRAAPPLATDPLVYHLPTAVQWLQTGKLGLFPTWYWNPAATYSPATSSTFMAWLMLPVRNDVFARFVQAPALLFIFLLVARLCREFGCGRAVAGLVGLAAGMSRPFVSEALIAKDDLFVTAFFGAAVLSLAPSNLRDRLGAWRVGLAFGMVLACKYTVLLVCPLFLFMADAPFRARWRARDWAVALGVGIPLFAPWYVRNVVLTGNPLFPVDVKLFGRTVFEGLFGTERDQQLRTGTGVWKMLGQTYHSLPAALIVPLAAAWLAGLAAARRAALRDPLQRACLIGSAATFALFLLTSPHHEVRYMYPLLLLQFGVAGMAIARWVRPAPMRVAAAGALAAVSAATAFEPGLMPNITTRLAQAAVATVVVVAAAVLQAGVFKLDARRLGYAAVALALVASMPVYVYWGLFLRTYYVKTSEIRAGGGTDVSGITFAWSLQYAAEEPLWTFVRENLPDDATIAIANTFFVYPFQDASYRRRLGHAPVRRGLHDFRDFPRMGDTVPGDLIVQRMTDVQNADPDKATWLENLRRLGAEYLVIATFPHESDPPERRLVAEERGLFKMIFEDPKAGAVYRIRWDATPAR